MEYDTIKNRTLRATNNSVFLLLQMWAETTRKERNQKVKRKTVSRNKDVGASKMTQPAEVFAAKPEVLSSIPRSGKMEGERLLKAVL